MVCRIKSGFRPEFLVLAVVIFGLQFQLGLSLDRDWIIQALTPEIHRLMLEGRIPSVTVALVHGEEIVWSEGFGYANIWARTPAVPSTVYLIGSTFKPMSAAALLQLMEQGKFELDDPVHRYLGRLKILGEEVGEPVTFRHLLTHTSGLPEAFDPFPVWGETSPPPLDQYLRDNLAVVSPPLQEIRYSNLAFSLIAYLVERLSGRTFKQYIYNHILHPAQMKSTAFEPTPQMEERLAIPYALDPETGRPQPTQRLKASVWPAGIVYGTVLDQANWLIVNLNRGVFKGQRILKPETVDLMMTRQYDQFAGPISAGFGNETTGYGLAWWTTWRNGERYFAHSGSVPGYTAFLIGNPSRQIGLAVMTNGHRAHTHLFELGFKAMDLLNEAASRPLPPYESGR